MPASQNSANYQQPPPNIDITSPYTPRRPAPILSLSINHPIGKGLRKLKNFLTHKQTLFATTFSIKVTPIVALVSFAGLAALFGGGITTAYRFGKTMEEKFLSLTPTPAPKVIIQAPAMVVLSRAGVIKATYQLQNQEESPPVRWPNGLLPGGRGDNRGLNSSSQSAILPTPTPTPTPTIIPTPTPIALHYILEDNNGSTTFLKPAKSISLKNYLNLRVLITGSYENATNTLSITKESDIEVLQ